MSVNNVLDEVESLFQKLNSLPDNIRQAAITRIQEKLNPVQHQPLNAQNDSSQQRPTSKGEVLEEWPLGNSQLDIPKLNEENIQNFGGSESSPSSYQSVYVEFFAPAEDEQPSHEHAETKVVPNHSSNLPLVEDVKLKVPKARKNSFTPSSIGYQCDECSRWFKGRRNLINHIRRHYPINPYACPKCDKTFSESSNLRVHLKRHNNQKDFKCDKCSYRSVVKIDLDRHKTTHSKDRNLICEICGKTFSSIRGVQMHIRNKHEEKITTYSCSESQCSFTTNHKSNLKIHMQVRHMGEYDNHVCPVCGAQVKLKGAFLQHMRSHTGEKPFSCAQCTSSFSCLANLNAHQRTIHAPPQFVCVTCDKKFKSKHALQRHETIHSKVRAHRCPFCQYASNTQSNLTKHVRSVHGQPDFSYRQHKQKLLACCSKQDPDKERKWTEKGEKAFSQYLSELSDKLGRQVTMDELREKEEERKRKQEEAQEKAQIDRISKIASKDHAYFVKPESTSLEPSETAFSNIYLEAIAAADLDLNGTSDATLALVPTSFPILGEDDTSVGKANDSTKVHALLNSDDYGGENSLMLVTSPEDRMLLNPVMSANDSDNSSLDLLVPMTDPSPSLMNVPNMLVELPNGEKVQFALISFLQDHSLPS